MSKFKDYIMSDAEYYAAEKKENTFVSKELKGLFNLKVIEAKAGDAKYGDSINMKLLVTEGEHEGYQFFHNIYFGGNNEVAERIAKHNFNALVRLCRFFNNPEDLCEVEFKANISTWTSPQTGKVRYNINVKKENKKLTTEDYSVTQKEVTIDTESDVDQIPF